MDADETDDMSESSAPSVVREKSPEVVVVDLFFLGSGGRTFPGSSFLSFCVGWRNHHNVSQRNARSLPSVSLATETPSPSISHWNF